MAQARALSGQCRLSIGIAWRGATNYLVPGPAHVPDQHAPEVAHGFGLVTQNNDLHARRSPLFGLPGLVSHAQVYSTTTVL